MDVEVLHDRASAVWHDPPLGEVAASASCTLRRADGTTLQTPAVTLPSASTTVTGSSSTAAALVVSSATGLRVGEPVAITDDGVTQVATVARIDGTTLHLVAALDFVPAAGATVKAIRLRATVTAPGVAELGNDLTLEWRYTTAGGDAGFGTSQVDVVRSLWQDPITVGEVAELLATVYQAPRSAEFCRLVAERVSAKIRNAVEQTGRRPYLYLSPSAFGEVAQVAARWVLADMGIGHVGDLAGLVREYRFAFADEMTKVVAGLRGYDSNNDGKFDSTERRNVVSIPTVR